MNKPTPGPWEKLGSIVFSAKEKKGKRSAVCSCGDEFIPSNGLKYGKERDANVRLIVAAVNACFAINPDNPLAVAEALPAMVNAVREAERYISSEKGEFSVDHDVALLGLRAVLAKLEAKS